MERKGELLYQRFLNTAQETVRLTTALEGFFLEADIEESQRDAYAGCVYQAGTEPGTGSGDALADAKKGGTVWIPRPGFHPLA